MDSNDRTTNAVIPASNSNINTKYTPKVSVKTIDSLFLLNYSDIPPPLNDTYTTPVNNKSHFDSLRHFKTFNVFLYIDIPTIDYYNDELKHNKLSKLNKKFKLHRLKEAILNSFTHNNNHLFWDFLIDQCSNEPSIAEGGEGEKKSISITILSSGSLRYVETFKYLMETIYGTLSVLTNLNKLDLKFKISVTPTTLKWFTTFLNKDLLNKNIIEFNNIGTYNSSINSISASPFKDYFSKLTNKFSKRNGQNPDELESITIITNNTGVKALLTILSDKPLTNFISQESIQELHESNSNSNSKANSNESTTSPPPLKRESSSLLNFQNSLLTSNKDKAVRIRSLSINRRSNKAHFFKTEQILGNTVGSPPPPPLNNHIMTKNDTLINTIIPTKNINSLIDKRQLHSRSPSLSSTTSLLSLPSASSFNYKTPIASPQPIHLPDFDNNNNSSSFLHRDSHHLGIHKLNSNASNASIQNSIIEYDEDEDEDDDDDEEEEDDDLEKYEDDDDECLS